MVENIPMRVSIRFHKTIEEMQKDIQKGMGVKISQRKATDIVANMMVGKKLIIRKESKKRWRID